PSQPVDTTMRLVLDIAAAQGTEPAAPQPAPQPPQTSELPPAFGTSSSPVRTITIDPGHGGEDEGVRGAEGTREKDLALSVARRLKAALEGRLGMRVLESANMPAVLIEMGYLTNPEQEKLLVSDAFQNGVVAGVYDAVLRFRDALAAGATR